MTRVWNMRFTALLVSSFLFFAALELGLRLVRHYFPHNPLQQWHAENNFPDFENKFAEAGLYYAHPYAAYLMKPDIPGHTNHLGFRGRDIATNKPAGMLRIACVGGSTIYGARNPDPFTLPRVLEDYLGGAGAGKVEVINGGLVSGTTMETLQIVQSKIIPLKPDLVIVYDGFNDLVPRIADHFESDYSHFRKSPANSLGRFTGWINHSALARELRHRFAREANLQDYIIRHENIPQSEEQRIRNFQSNGPEYFKDHLEMIIRVLLAYNIKVAVPTFAFQDGLHDAWITIFPDALWSTGIAQNNRTIRELTAQYHLPLIDLNAYCAGKSAFFSGKIHFNNGGSVAVARFLGAELLKAYPELFQHTAVRLTPE